MLAKDGEQQSQSLAVDRTLGNGEQLQASRMALRETKDLLADAHRVARQVIRKRLRIELQSRAQAAGLQQTDRPRPPCSRTVNDDPFRRKESSQIEAERAGSCAGLETVE